MLVRFRRVFLFVATNYSDVECYYNKSKLFVITVGILNPSLLSITTSNHTTTMSTALFWTVWTLQLLTSLVTAYVTAYKWDKKYFCYMAGKARIEQEMWTYLELTGRYSIVNPTLDEEIRLGRTTHRTKLPLFLLQIEIIYRRLRDSDIDIESSDVEESGNENRKTQPIVVPADTDNTNLANYDAILIQRCQDLQQQIDILSNNTNTDNNTDTHASDVEGTVVARIDELRQQMTQYERVLEKNRMHAEEGTMLRGGTHTLRAGHGAIINDDNRGNDDSRNVDDNRDDGDDGDDGDGDGHASDDDDGQQSADSKATTSKQEGSN